MHVYYNYYCGNRFSHQFTQSKDTSDTSDFSENSQSSTWTDKASSTIQKIFGSKKVLENMIKIIQSQCGA